MLLVLLLFNLCIIFSLLIISFWKSFISWSFLIKVSSLFCLYNSNSVCNVIFSSKADSSWLFKSLINSSSCLNLFWQWSLLISSAIILSFIKFFSSFIFLFSVFNFSICLFKFWISSNFSLLCDTKDSFSFS